MKRIYSGIAILIVIMIIALAIYIRMLWPTLPFINPDSGAYLSPPFTKVLIGEWHKGERPMQYLLFLYCSMSEKLDICRITIVQHSLAICAGLFLFFCYMLTGRGSSVPRYIRVLIGALLLWMFWINPNVLYYEQLVGPESYSMFLESLVMLSMALVILYQGSLRQDIFWMTFIFLVLYISNPMPKFFMASMVIAGLTAMYIMGTSLPPIRKMKILLIPGAIYLFTVFIPEFIFKPDNINQDRTNIEWKQMTYTHFDVLMSDTAHLPMTSDLKMGLMRCYISARKADCYKVLGFSSDELMWGEANRLIEEHYNKDNDSVFALYKSLAFSLVKRYPMEVAGQILRQVASFYLPDHTMKNNVWSNNSVIPSYQSSAEHARGFDYDMRTYYRKRPQADYTIGHLYPPTYEASGFIDITQMFVFQKTMGTFIYRRFDYIFFIGMILFFLVRALKGEIGEFHILYLVHTLLFFYVIAVAIVHTFDIDRFTSTIYPLLLISIFIEIDYFLDLFYRFLGAEAKLAA